MAGTSATLVADAAPLSVTRRRVVLAATIGNSLEWYDFLIYGFLAVTIAKLFFPTENELTSLLLSVGTFGAAAIVRPIAGVVLGIYADRVGRKAALTLTIFTMGFGTGLIVVAPVYASDRDLGPSAAGDCTPAAGLCLQRRTGRSNGNSRRECAGRQ